MPNVYTLVCSATINVQSVPTEYVSPIRLSVAAGLGLQPVPTLTRNALLTLKVSAGLGLQPQLAVTYNAVHTLAVSAGLGLQGVASLTKTSVYNLSLAVGLGLQATSSLAKISTYSLTVSAGLGFQAQTAASEQSVHTLSVAAGIGVSGTLRLARTYQVAVSAGLGVSTPPPVALQTHVLAVSAGLGFQVLSGQNRVLVLSVSSGLGLQSSPTPQTQIYQMSVSVGLGVSSSPSLTKSNAGVSTTLGIQALASAILVSAASVPGGPSTVLLRGISGTFPLSFAETPSGVVLAANGVDPMIRWDGLSTTASFAGVQPPTTAPTLTASGLGVITGLRYAFCRFIDNRGNPSNLSPVGVPVQCGRDQLLDGITLSATGAVTITSRSHGLATNASLFIQGVTGLPINGQWTIKVIDQDHFTLNGIVLTSGSWLGGGSWVNGASAITYGGLPTSSQSSVTSLQLLRNLDGNFDVLYVETSVPLGTTQYVSTASDELLSLAEPVVLRTQDNWPLAYRYSPPPSNRPYLVNYMGRVFAAGDAVVYAGCVQVTSGSLTIQGFGTQWTSQLAGRQIYVKGSSRPYGILSVNTTTQLATLTSPYADPSQLFATYLIRSSAAERKVIQWSEPDNPEAWPPWNALGLPEDNDEITGMFVKGTYLFITERRHIWKFQFSDDPARSGHVFLVLDQRGAINSRVISQADDKVFLMDEAGIYSYDGGSGIEPISDPIQTCFYADGLTFTYQVDWTQDQTLWHASLDPTRTIIRWFVSMLNQPNMTCALAYNYRLERWWVEQYPISISSSCTATLAEAPNAAISAGSRRAMVGAEARMVLVLGEGALDIATDSGTLRGTATASTSTSITDGLASFAAGLGGCPIQIVSGTGQGQSTLISSNTSTVITVVEPWTVLPDNTSTYQIGGVPWQWRSGWLDVEDEEGDTNRDFIIGFQPLESETTMSVQFFYDHSTSPELWAYPKVQDGVSVAANAPDMWIDMTSSDVLPGYRVFRQAQHTERYAYSDRYVQIYMYGVTNDEVVRVYQVSLRGVDNEGL